MTAIGETIIPGRARGCLMLREKNWQAYWGGDFAGIEQKLGYIKGMGATAIWISPVVNNENLNCATSGVSGPYHSYWNRDFMNIEEHFGDNTNSFAAFDKLVGSLHANGMKMIVDQANNHSNPRNCGEKGSLYNNGTLMASVDNDPKGYFHHNPNVPDNGWDDRYLIQYYTLSDLADLNQENPDIDAYLKSSAALLQSHGVDAFRLDAVKHATWGWEESVRQTRCSRTVRRFYSESGSSEDREMRFIRMRRSSPIKAEFAFSILE